MPLRLGVLLFVLVSSLNVSFVPSGISTTRWTSTSGQFYFNLSLASRDSFCGSHPNSVLVDDAYQLNSNLFYENITNNWCATFVAFGRFPCIPSAPEYYFDVSSGAPVGIFGVREPQVTTECWAGQGDCGYTWLNDPWTVRVDTCVEESYPTGGLFGQTCPVCNSTYGFKWAGAIQATPSIYRPVSMWERIVGTAGIGVCAAKPDASYVVRPYYGAYGGCIDRFTWTTANCYVNGQPSGTITPDCTYRNGRVAAPTGRIALGRVDTLQGSSAFSYHTFYNQYSNYFELFGFTVKGVDTNINDVENDPFPYIPIGLVGGSQIAEIGEYVPVAIIADDPLFCWRNIFLCTSDSRVMCVPETGGGGGCCSPDKFLYRANSTDYNTTRTVVFTTSDSLQTVNMTFIVLADSPPGVEINSSHYYVDNGGCFVVNVSGNLFGRSIFNLSTSLTNCTTKKVYPYTCCVTYGWNTSLVLADVMFNYTLWFSDLSNVTVSSRLTVGNPYGSDLMISCVEGVDCFLPGLVFVNSSSVTCGVNSSVVIANVTYCNTTLNLGANVWGMFSFSVFESDPPRVSPRFSLTVNVSAVNDPISFNITGNFTIQHGECSKFNVSVDDADYEESGNKLIISPIYGALASKVVVAIPVYGVTSPDGISGISVYGDRVKMDAVFNSLYFCATSRGFSNAIVNVTIYDRGEQFPVGATSSWMLLNFTISPKNSTASSLSSTVSTVATVIVAIVVGFFVLAFLICFACIRWVFKLGNTVIPNTGHSTSLN